MNVCVFCGSASGFDAEYSSAARELGQMLAQNGHTLVYGGGSVGLMGIIAQAVLASKGKVIGIIPAFLLDREVGHDRLSRLEVVETMHERKLRMAQLSNAILILPGGIGTLDETAEMLTWRQLGLIHHPFGLLNTRGYFDTFLQMLKEMQSRGFLAPNFLDIVHIAGSPSELLHALGL